MALWETAVADGRTHDITIRGYPLDSLVEGATFADLVYLLLAGDLPTRPQRQMVDAILVSLAERGIAPSSMIARSVVSSGSPVQAGVAAGLLSIGDRIGGACEQAAQLFAELVERDPAADLELLVREYREQGRRVPGFGYPEHESRDPRAELLCSRARELGIFGVHCEMMNALEREVESQSGRPLPANVNGALAAIILDLGLPAQSARGFILIPRVAGLIAHIVEEMAGRPAWHGADPADVQYNGPARREFPDGSEVGPA